MTVQGRRDFFTLRATTSSMCKDNNNQIQCFFSFLYFHEGLLKENTPTPITRTNFRTGSFAPLTMAHTKSILNQILKIFCWVVVEAASHLDKMVGETVSRVQTAWARGFIKQIKSLGRWEVNSEERASYLRGHRCKNSIKRAKAWRQLSRMCANVPKVAAHQCLVLLLFNIFFNNAKDALPPISVWVKKNQVLLFINPIQIKTTWSLKQCGHKQWRKSMRASIELGKWRVTAISGPLVKLFRGRERKIFKCIQVELGRAQNSFNTHTGLTLSLDNIHGIRRSLQWN